MSTKDVNAVVASAEATIENTNVVAPQQQVETIEATIARLCKVGSKVVKTSFTCVECEERTAKNGSKYINAACTLETAVPGALKMSDGTYRIGNLGMIQTPFNAVMIAFRKHRFFGRFVAAIEDAASINMVSSYLAGLDVSVFCHFVAAGEVGHNPFTRAANEYPVKDYDRYVYYVVGVDTPTDPLVLDEYRNLNAEQRKARLEAIAAKRAAVASTASLLATATAADEIPF